MTLFVVIISQITGLQKKAWGRWVLAPLLNEFYPRYCSRLEDLVSCTDEKLNFRKYNKKNIKVICKLIALKLQKH